MRASRLAALAAGLALAAAAPGAATAADAHGGHAAAPHAAAAGAPGSQLGGVLVRESAVAGYKLAYRLFSWAERNVMMKDMLGMTMAGMNEKGTHHLMVFVRGADGRPVGGGKVGFLVKGPDGAEQKTLTMGMNDGYGADVILRDKGSYAIRLKAEFGGATVAEDFTYEVK